LGIDVFIGAAVFSGFAHCYFTPKSWTSGYKNITHSGAIIGLVYVQGHINYFAIDKIDTYGGRRAVRDSAGAHSPAAGFLHYIDVNDSCERWSSAYACGCYPENGSCADEAVEADFVIAAACFEVDGAHAVSFRDVAEEVCSLAHPEDGLFVAGFGGEHSFGLGFCLDGL
jgi:hypothetical protein